MQKSFLEHSANITPPQAVLQVKLIPVVLKLKDTYILWQTHARHFPKTHRYTLGSKIDDLFLATIEYCFLASYSNLGDKIPLVDKGISRVDLIKLLLQISFEIKALDMERYIKLAENLYDTGKMLGGWKKQLLNKKLQEVNLREK
jgi:hypothetical protein